MKFKFYETTHDVVKACRTKLGEWNAPNDFERVEELDIVQLKLDGWWCACHISGNQIKIITSGADIRQVWSIENPKNIEALLIGEWMYGTNWSQSHNPGNIYIHDIAYWESDNQIDGSRTSFNLSEGFTYEERIHYLEWFQMDFLEMTGKKMQLVPTFLRRDLMKIWNDNPGHEGVVLKSSRSGFGCNMIGVKIKHEFTEDYVVMEIQEGGGRLLGKMGAIVGGQYVDGVLKSICTVGGGFSDAQRQDIWDNYADYLNSVFEAYGKGKFPSGALRHPNFRNWRPDKLPENCK